MRNFALQMYSVRDHLATDREDTYRQVKDAGYDSVELFAVAPEEAEATHTLLEDIGLTVLSIHMEYSLVVNATRDVIMANRVLGSEYVVVPWLDLKTGEEWLNAAKEMDRAGREFREAGLQLGYHNHHHEFAHFEGQSAFDIIFETASPDNLFAQLDLYWATTGGADPVELLARFKGRCPLIHVKDRAREGSCAFAEIGRGTTDWPAIFEAAQNAGVQWYIVEQDESILDSLESAAISAMFMAKQ